MEKESQLIGIERKLVEIQGISIAPLNQNIIIAERPVLLEKDLHQYRVMFYFMKILGDINRLKPSDEESTIQIEIRLFEATTSYPLLFNYKVRQSTITHSSNPRSRTPSYKTLYFDYNDMANLNFLRFYYFFSLTTDITDFLARAQLEVSIFEINRLNNKKLLGRSFVSALEDFNICDKQEIGTQGFATRHTMGIKLFIKDINLYYDMPIIAGIAYDGQRDTSHISLKKYEDFQAYYPHNDFFTSDLIPSEWMEIFDEKEVLRNRNLYMPGQYEPNVKESEYDLDLTKMRKFFSIQRAKTEKFKMQKLNNEYKDKHRNVATEKSSPLRNASPNKFKIYRSVTRRMPLKEDSPLISLYFKKKDAPK